MTTPAPLAWWQDDPGFMAAEWDWYDADVGAQMTLTDGRRLALTYIRDHGPICGEVDKPGQICNLSPGHECPHLGTARYYVVELGERTALSVTCPSRGGDA